MVNKITSKIIMFEAIGGNLASISKDAMVQELKEITLKRVVKSGSCSAAIGPPSLPASRVDLDGMIIPKKIPNPHLDSKEAQDLNREIRWNAKTGINVLASKSELQRALEKRSRHKKIQEKHLEEDLKKTPFQKALEERAKRLEQLEKCQNDDNGHVSEDSGHCSPEPETEFLKVHAQLRERNGTISYF